MSAQTPQGESDTLPARTVGLWASGNATDLTAQVGASAAAGAHINARLATADTDAVLAAAQECSG
ncbi:hypothetical protein [Nocardiopsis sp. LOL_012]|uniref:hypothetical protein n=1 Tax=Nocardiopsis sp. LOL_012 TaxID=3345409 RepID=UPI003A87B860